jgi:hypothetical protein
MTDQDDRKNEGAVPDAALGAGPRRRTYPETPPKGLADTDSAERAFLLKTLTFSGGGAVVGFLGGTFAASGIENVAVARALPLATAVSFWLGTFVITFAMTRFAGWTAGRFFHPGGGGAPRREYSYPETLAAQGRYLDAVTVFRLAAAENPTDVTPLLRAARICRDALHDHEEALRCFRLARDVKGVTERQWRMITREVIELLAGPLAQPVRAAPELARLAERAAGAPEGEWAAAELAAVKKMIAASEA